MGLLLNVSNSHLFWQGKEPEEIGDHHRPHLLAFPREGSIADAKVRLHELAEGASGDNPDDNDLAKIHSIGEPTTYQSFWDHGRSRDVVPVVAKRSYWVPDISDRLFFDHGFWTCEHDIPYRERAVADLAAEKDWWMFDSRGRPAKLSVLTYDIEMTKFEAGRTDVPIDVVGWSDFPVEYESFKDLEEESLDFSFRDLPQDWSKREVSQVTARNVDEELDMLHDFTRRVVKHDVVAGHNILGFDNKQIHDRLRHFLSGDQKSQNLSPSMRKWFEEFTSVYSRHDRSFHFGSSSDIAVWHPASLDTFHAARKFFFFHDDFTLKGLAPWLGIHVDDRVYLEPDQMQLDAATLQYNKHDVQEQLGVTQALIAQALPLAFTVNLPLDELLTGGNTKMWDHMAFLRARRQRKFMPATCRALSVCRGVQRLLPHNEFPSREEVSDAALQLDEEARAGSGMREFVRVAKQGPEMPFWVEHPMVVADPNAASEEPTGYDIVGGLTLKPDSELKSHFVPWFHVVEADVGAMYPTILKARNLTADTVQPCRKGEDPDDWIWLNRLHPAFTESGKYLVRKPEPEETYTHNRGWLVGVKQNKEPGLVNSAMTGILESIQKVKDARAKAKADGLQEVKIHDMTYASLKAARNAGTHGILVAVNVSCRQFNVWGGANITTIGQRILHDTRQDFEEDGIRVVYGDTDGIYLGCSRSAGNLPHLASALGVEAEPEADKWITLPDVAIQAVEDANQKWRRQLDYPGFELEAERYDAMVFVVHKNYLKFSTRDGRLVMETKGNNFRGSDKAPLAQNILKEIMAKALAEVSTWDDEEEAREAMKAAIKRATREIMQGRDVTGTKWEELTLRQSVRPIRGYKPNPDGSASSFAMRTACIEQLIGEQITAGRKMKFIVCKEPLPGYLQTEANRWVRDRLQRNGLAPNNKKPRKSGIKPIEYMWPIEKVETHMVDWSWYKEMVEAYVKGAFGFDTLELAVQRDLSSWF